MPPLTRLDPQSLTLPPCFSLKITTYRHDETIVTTMDAGTEKHNSAFGMFHISIEVARQVSPATPVTPLDNVMERVEAAWEDGADYHGDDRMPFFKLVLIFSTTTKLQPLHFSQPDFWQCVGDSKDHLLDLVETMLENIKPLIDYPMQPSEWCQNTPNWDMDMDSDSESE